MSTSDNKSSQDKAKTPEVFRSTSYSRVKKLGAQAIKGTPRARFRFFGSLTLKASTNKGPIEPKNNKNNSKRPRKNSKSSTKSSQNKRQNIPEDKPKSSLWHRLDVRLPWLKLVAVTVVGFIAIIDLLDLTISHVNDPYNTIRVAPMSKHLRASERILEGKKLVAITFDDGPSPATTPHLLDILFEKDVPATFFMLGYMVRNNPDLAKRIDREYHVAASHTMYHQNLVRLSGGAAEADIKEARDIIRDQIGHDPKYTRPPYGNTNDIVRKVANTPIILWSVDTLDWQSKNPEAIVSTALSQVQDGAIILMHDIYPSTVEAVPTLIDKLRENGYEFATLEELADTRGVQLNNSEVYYRISP